MILFSDALGEGGEVLLLRSLSDLAWPRCPMMPARSYCEPSSIADRQRVSGMKTNAISESPIIADAYQK